MQIKLIFTKVWHFASFWNWEVLELGKGQWNGLFSYLCVPQSSKNGIINLLEKDIRYDKVVQLNTTIDFYDFLSLKTTYFIIKKEELNFLSALQACVLIKARIQINN